MVGNNQDRFPVRWDRKKQAMVLHQRGFREGCSLGCSLLMG